MYTIGDAVLEHVKMQIGSTCHALKVLGLNSGEYEGANYPAGNFYMAALEIIRKLQKELEDKKC